MSEDLNDMVDCVFKEEDEKRKITTPIRNGKFAKMPSEMLTQIESEASEFKQIDKPTGEQKFEQACRIALLLSRKSEAVFDITMRKTQVGGTLELLCDTVTLFALSAVKLWNELNCLSGATTLSYDEKAYHGLDVITVQFIIGNSN